MPTSFLLFVTDTSVTPILSKYNTSVEPFAELRVAIHIHRESLYYEVNLVMPYTLVALLTIMVYFLPPDTGDRIGLGGWLGELDVSEIYVGFYLEILS